MSCNKKKLHHLEWIKLSEKKWKVKIERYWCVFVCVYLRLMSFFCTKYLRFPRAHINYHLLYYFHKTIRIIKIIGQEKQQTIVEQRRKRLSITFLQPHCLPYYFEKKWMHVMCISLFQYRMYHRVINITSILYACVCVFVCAWKRIVPGFKSL